MGAGIAAAVGWLAANAGAIAGVASAGAAVYSATQMDSGIDIQNVDTATTIDKTVTDQEADLDAVKIGKDDDSASGAKAKFKVKRPETPATTGVNVSASPTGVQI